jgi:hypothetical protein
MPNWDDDDDGDPTFAVRSEEPTCPKCQRILTAGVTVCPACGHDQKPRPANYKPLAKHWDAGWTLAFRVRVLVIVQGLCVVAVSVAGFTGEVVPALIAWLVFTAISTFMLGTFDCVDLKRNPQGRVTLTRTWRVFFVPMQPFKAKLGDYDGVTSGIDRDADMFDWLIFCVLFGVGFIPGIIWWYLAIHRDRFFVALANGHGAPAYYLYRGASQEQMEEMTQTIQDVAFAI